MQTLQLYCKLCASLCTGDASRARFCKINKLHQEAPSLCLRTGSYESSFSRMFPTLDTSRMRRGWKGVMVYRRNILRNRVVLEGLLFEFCTCTKSLLEIIQLSNWPKVLVWGTVSRISRNNRGFSLTRIIGQHHSHFKVINSARVCPHSH